ncbi:hypothetical protein GSI_04913 [Ganoderma sinense ZZ0214-1]|uniref:Uncharacterized protein n=1 Tax=Ganoderma sinense ZZ0214-1 TaxID=1077348 RepID=A0A2G8SG98_9APHY|nr:hypothetical protein GSI_04913 [Ganoderma sinense ZZ0214-1]
MQSSVVDDHVCPVHGVYAKEKTLERTVFSEELSPHTSYLPVSPLVCTLSIMYALSNPRYKLQSAARFTITYTQQLDALNESQSALLTQVNAEPYADLRYESTILCTDAYVPPTRMNAPTRMMK